MKRDHGAGAVLVVSSEHVRVAAGLVAVVVAGGHLSVALSHQLRNGLLRLLGMSLGAVLVVAVLLVVSVGVGSKSATRHHHLLGHSVRLRVVRTVSALVHLPFSVVAVVTVHELMTGGDEEASGVDEEEGGGEEDNLGPKGDLGLDGGKGHILRVL